MARTPLLQTLQRLAHDSAEAESRGIAVEDVQEQHRLLSKGIRRRDLLKSAGIIAGGIALAPLPGWGERILNASASGLPRIGIIGAGIAGMNAALTLTDAGLPATIYEAAGRIGGRMHSNTKTWANQQVTEWCGELIDTDHTTIQGLAKRFSLPLVDLHKAEPPGSQTTYYFSGKYYTQAQANSDFKPVFAVLKQQLKAAPITMYNHYNSTGYQLDHISVYDWIEQYVPGGHTATMGQLLDAAYNSEFGRETTV
ncbi:MAG TPA: FAD-dependent oxidoreductase, partial [Ktedonobacteraceae bacterium]|nr:FAD-dependent oxidoreductase [Ktedonobacteraceae bacterium]